eukprot:TRINITY_DN7645_c0_g1_i2.p2 TRINITY_DN7645_c0_g1~~TRINITY_DN7645_c0_g1_i2.p2  ORF type:complete len:217 (+),score=65.08 TRINITY_DN7645_c0_g1_i2:61-711(+)
MSDPTEVPEATPVDLQEPQVEGEVAPAPDAAPEAVEAAETGAEAPVADQAAAQPAQEEGQAGGETGEEEEEKPKYTLDLPTPNHLHGIVRNWHGDRNYGFIQAPDNKDLFYHARSNGWKGLHQGKEVTFIREEQSDGRVWAIDVQGPGTFERPEVAAAQQNNHSDGSKSWSTEEPLDVNATHKGRVKSWNRDKGYGFILHECGRDIFCHTKVWRAA